jgi:hypothetical protein
MPKLSKASLDFHAVKLDYVSEVLKNLSKTGDPLAEVRFGTSGEGVQPNYEIKTTSGQAIAYRGNTHKASEEHDQWDDDNLTEPFSREEIQRGFDISLKSTNVAKKYILDNLKSDPEKYSHPDAKQAPLLIAAVMSGTPLDKAFDDLRKVQHNARD